MLGWIQEPHHYFEDFEGMVNSIFIWIAIGYIAINVGAFVFCLIRYHSERGEVSHNFGIALWLNTCGLIVAFAIACVVFGAGVFFKEQDYNLVRHWYGILTKQAWVIIICALLGAGLGIFLIVTFIGNDMEAWGAIILGILIGGATFAACLYIVGFVVYCVVWFVWLVIRFIMVVVSSFVVSIGLFAAKHYLIFSLTIGVPAATFGLVGALVGYIRSFGSNVGPARIDPRLRYVEAAQTAASRQESKPQQSKDDDEDIVIDD